MRVVVAQDQPAQAEPIRRLLLGLGLECGANDCVALAALPVRLSSDPADLIIIGLATDPTATLHAIRQAPTLSRAPVLGLGPTTDARQVLQILQAGAREFIDEAHLQADLEGALERLRVTGAVQHGLGRIVGVVSPTPGSGVTTVATNLAFTWAGKYPERVALLELGREPAEMALCLDITPRHSITDVIQNWERMDAALLHRSMTAHAAGVQVLTHAPTALTVPGIDPQAMRKTLILLRTIYKAAVLDLGHTLESEHYEAMRLCDVLALVVRLDVPGLRQARELLNVLMDRGLATERIRLIANRYGQRGQIAWKQAEDAIGSKFAAYIPDDSGKMNQALNQGKPVVQASRLSRIARRFAMLAQQLNGEPR